MDIFSKWTSLEARGMLIHLLSPMPIFAHADFRPQHIRWKLPLRLLVGCKAYARNLTLDLYWTSCTSMTVKQVVARLAKLEDPTSSILNPAQVGTWYWIIWSLP